MSTPAAARNKRGLTPSAAVAAAAANPARTLGRGPTAVASFLSRGGRSAVRSRSLVRGGGSAAAAACGGGFDGSSSAMEEFPISPIDGSSAWFDAASVDPSSPGSCVSCKIKQETHLKYIHLGLNLSESMLDSLIYRE